MTTSPWPRALLGPALVATTAAALVPGTPMPALGVVLLAVAVRLVLDARGVELEAPRGWLLFWTLGPCVAGTLVPFAVGFGVPVAGALLAAGTVGVAAALVAPSSPLAWARVLGLSALLLTGVCLRAPPTLTALACAAFLATAVRAVVTLPLLPRTRAAPAGGLVRRVEARVDGDDPDAPPRGTTWALLAATAALGALLFTVLPRTDAGGPSSRPDPDEAAAAAGGFGGRGAGDDDGGAVTGGGQAPTSPYRSNLTSSARIELAVRFADGERGPEPLYLRGMAYDEFDGVTWRRSAAADAATACEVAPDGRVVLGPDTGDRPRWQLEVEDVGGRAARGALIVLPGVDRARLLDREGLPLLQRAADGICFLGPGAGWTPGARYRLEGPSSDGDRSDLVRRRSDRGVSPLPTYLHLPPASGALTRYAATVTADAATPADRARRLEARLRSRPFTYARTGLQLNPRAPVTDFLLAKHEGHCWCFASAMTLLCRGVGIPARFVTGYRGGEYLRSARLWTFRGLHAHAWCEVWFDGRGWVRFDPTPGGDREDDETTSADLRDRDDGPDAFDARAVRERLEAAGRATMEAIGRAPPWLLAVVGALVLLVLLGLGRRLARTAGLLPGGAVAGPLGAYRRALAAMARLGVARRRPETPREFLVRAAAAVPVAGAGLGTVTDDHDETRYGGRPPTAERTAAADAAADALTAEAARRRAAARRPDAAPPPDRPGPGGP